jgi:hypothetical protein
MPLRVQAHEPPMNEGSGIRKGSQLTSSLVRLVAASTLWAGCATVLEATPLIGLNAAGTCANQEERQSCSELGILTGWRGAPLPENLADLYTITVITGDRSAAMINGLWLSRHLPEALSAAAAAAGQEEMVVSAEMVFSVQMSLDARIDASEPRLGAIGSVFPLPARKAGRLQPGGFERRQIDVTLGAAVNSIQTTQNVNMRDLAKSDYMSFSLVNQAHLNARPMAEPEPEQETGSPQ